MQFSGLVYTEVGEYIARVVCIHCTDRVYIVHAVYTLYTRYTLYRVVFVAGWGDQKRSIMVFIKLKENGKFRYFCAFVLFIFV